MHYITSGDRHGLPIIFIHGFPFDHSMWEPQLNALPDKYYYIAYDIRGFGKSEGRDGINTIEQFADDLETLMKNLSMEKAVICGLSMGGYIALRFAEKYPQRLKGLVLADTRSEQDTDEARLKRAGQVKEISKSGLDDFVDGMLKAVFADKNFVQNISGIPQLKRVMLSHDPKSVKGALLAMAARTDTTPSLPDIKIPVLIIVGEEDKITPPESAQKMHGMIAGSELTIIPGAGHLSNMENPQAFNNALLTFLDKLS
ncbi:MAG: alpha/beta hydrolase [Bacteroidota bacterium]|nr:alpha/beta hydrolase [Bacteroidota bacterium]